MQTRQPVDDTLLFATRGAVDRFHTEELRLRAELGYPPLTTFYLLTWHGDQATIAGNEAMLKDKFGSLQPEFYTNPQSRAALITRHCLIRTEGKMSAEKLESLRHLPPHITVTVNPDRIV